MTQEEKAKRYDETLEQLKGLIEGTREDKCAIVEEDIIGIFHELAESEDERIRKELISYHRSMASAMNGNRPCVHEAWIAWLEKQAEKDKLIQELGKYKVKYTQEVLEKHLGNQSEQKPNPCDGCINRKGCINCENGELRETEQKSTNNVEPKFKVGDWITDGYIYGQITNIDDNYPCYKIQETTGGIYSSIPFKLQDNYHLWTIEDAKYGDVLTYKNDDVEWILIYKYIIEESLDVLPAVLKYHALFTGTDFYDSGIAGMISENYASRFTPASKEQRDLLFQKMKEAGYGWDTEKKKLKKLTQSVTKISDQDAWSYEDEANLNNIIWLCNNCINGSETTWIPSQAKKIKHLIETIKERGLSQQKPTEWNEEDEENLQHCCGAVFVADYYTYEDKQDMEKWLLQLKERIGG